MLPLDHDGPGRRGRRQERNARQIHARDLRFAGVFVVLPQRGLLVRHLLQRLHRPERRLDRRGERRARFGVQRPAQDAALPDPAPLQPNHQTLPGRLYHHAEKHDGAYSRPLAILLPDDRGRALQGRAAARTAHASGHRIGSLPHGRVTRRSHGAMAVHVRDGTHLRIGNHVVRRPAPRPRDRYAGRLPLLEGPVRPLQRLDAGHRRLQLRTWQHQQGAEKGRRRSQKLLGHLSLSAPRNARLHSVVHRGDLCLHVPQTAPDGARLPADPPLHRHDPHQPGDAPGTDHLHARNADRGAPVAQSAVQAGHHPRAGQNLHADSPAIRRSPLPGPGGRNPGQGHPLPGPVPQTVEPGRHEKRVFAHLPDLPCQKRGHAGRHRPASRSDRLAAGEVEPPQEFQSDSPDRPATRNLPVT
mgnify:CR=1 FL=1